MGESGAGLFAVAAGDQVTRRVVAGGPWLPAFHTVIGTALRVAVLRLAQGVCLVHVQQIGVAIPRACYFVAWSGGEREFAITVLDALAAGFVAGGPARPGFERAWAVDTRNISVARLVLFC